MCSDLKVLCVSGGCGPDRDHLILSPLHADSATQTWDIDVLWCTETHVISGTEAKSEPILQIQLLTYKPIIDSGPFCWKRQSSTVWNCSVTVEERACVCVFILFSALALAETSHAFCRCFRWSHASSSWKCPRELFWWSCSITKAFRWSTLKLVISLESFRNTNVCFESAVNAPQTYNVYGDAYKQHFLKESQQ